VKWTTKDGDNASETHAHGMPGSTVRSFRCGRAKTQHCGLRCGLFHGVCLDGWNEF
jgi:hypothetical protein